MVATCRSAASAWTATKLSWSSTAKVALAVSLTALVALIAAYGAARDADRTWNEARSGAAPSTWSR